MKVKTVAQGLTASRLLSPESSPGPFSFPTSFQPRSISFSAGLFVSSEEIPESLQDAREHMFAGRI